MSGAIRFQLSRVSAAAVAIPSFIIFKTVMGLVLIKFSATYLSVSGFTFFTQFLLFSSLLNILITGGAQAGLVRQTAIAGDLFHLRRTQDAAYAIWMGATLVVVPLALLLKNPLSNLLIGSDRGSPMVIWIALLCAAGGPSQIYASILTGTGRVTTSLVAQAAGIAVGGAGALTLLFLGNERASVLAFAAGPVVTTVVGWWNVHNLKLPTRNIRESIFPETFVLIKYSATYLATTASLSISMFLLRDIYRGKFGVEALGLWLVAARMSDVNIQLPTMFAGQLFLPAFARSDSITAGRQLTVRYFAILSAMMVLGVVVFSASPRFFVHLFLSDRYAPAIAGMIVYLVADVLRVSAALAMNIAVARRRFAYLLSLELATVVLFSVIMLLGIGMLGRSAPFVAQLATQTIVAMFMWWLFWRVYRRSVPPRLA